MKKLQLTLFNLFLLANLFASNITIYNNIKIDNKANSKAVNYAIKALEKDFCRKFGNTINPKFKQTPITLSFEIENKEKSIKSKGTENFDQYTTIVKPHHITFVGTDELGLIHGIYNFSKNELGIDPYIYFTGIMPKLESEIKIKGGTKKSKPFSTKYRAFFFNDEDLLTGFKMEKLAYGFNLKFMQKVFETTLRLGMNGVIPSTLVLSDEPHLALAADMGLYIMQHHAEPLGSVPLFWSKDKIYSWSTNKQAFIDFWTTAIKRQKSKKVVWTLGFRGLLDRSFWADDPTISDKSPGKDKAKIINEVIATQYDLIKKTTGNQHPIVSAVLRAETISLFEKDLLKFPKGTIILFCDDGFGNISNTLMKKAKHSTYPLGTYMHVSLHNRNAQIRINCVDPNDLSRQMKAVYYNNMNNMCVLNVGNMKEKIFGIQQMVLYLNDWEKYKDLDGEKYYEWYAKNKLGTSSEKGTKEIAQIYRDFINNQFRIEGQRRKAGDEFYSCFPEKILNMLFTHRDDKIIEKNWLPTPLSKKVNSLKKITKKDKTSTFGLVNEELKITLDFYSNLMDSVSNKWETSMQRAYSAKENLKGDKLDFYKIDVMYPTEKMFHLTKSTEKFSKAVTAYMNNDFQKAQENCYDALNHAKAAVECEKKIENNHTGEFKDWYRFDENARTWYIPKILENFLNNIKDMKYTSLEYKYRNSKTPDLEYKMQPWFKSQYKDELFYMNNAQ